MTHSFRGIPSQKIFTFQQKHTWARGTYPIFLERCAKDTKKMALPFRILLFPVEARNNLIFANGRMD